MRMYNAMDLNLSTQPYQTVTYILPRIHFRYDQHPVPNAVHCCQLNKTHKLMVNPFYCFMLFLKNHTVLWPKTTHWRLLYSSSKVA